MKKEDDVMKRLTHERTNGIKTGYWSPNKKQELVDTLAAYENTELTPEKKLLSCGKEAENGRIDMQEKKILDVTCGGRSIWFNKHNPAAVYCDKRREQFNNIWKNAGNCTVDINPDVICDFTDLPFRDNSFHMVIFDPPHLTSAKETSWLVKKYGKLDKDWPKMLHDGFQECMRVLKTDGVLIFKWSEYDIPAADVWEAIGRKPLFGHHSGKKQ